MILPGLRRFRENTYKRRMTKKEEEVPMKIFNLDSPVMVFLTKMANLMILNLLTILCCIPIITGGAAITALYYVTLKMARGEDPYIVKSYFKSFAQNFKQATVIWIGVLLVAVALFMDWKILEMYELTGILGKILYGILIAVIIIVMVTAIYVFPVLSRFENTIRVTVKNARLMSILNIPRSVLMVLIHLLPVGMILVSDSMTPVVLMLGIPLVAYLCSMNFVKIFKPFEPEAEAAPAEDEYELPPFMMEEESTVENAQLAAETAENAETVRDADV